MTDTQDTRCIAEARAKRGTTGNHTLRCQKPAGHDGPHEHKRDNVSSMWFGEPVKMEGNTRWRFGLPYGWQHG